MRISLASRQSVLAKIQAYKVGEALKTLGHEVEYLFRESLGDQNLDDPLYTMGDKGVFTLDFLNDLINEKIDMVVHSWKDLPTQGNDETEVVATLDREDRRDVLLVRKESLSKSEVCVLTSSPRREYNLSRLLPRVLPYVQGEPRRVTFKDVRGNIPTRMTKLVNGQGDALVVAKAALDRLLSADREDLQETRTQVRDLLSQCEWMVMPLSENPPAAAQGALAIEVKKTRKDLIEALKKLNHPEVFETVAEERKILASHGGGCHQKIGVSVSEERFGRLLSLKGLTEAGKVLDQWQVMGEKPPSSGKHIFPQDPTTQSFFKREAMPKVQKPSGKEFFVSRQQAWPQHWSFSTNEILWASGLKTWEALARRGLLVRGCQDSLGWSKDMGIDALLGRPPHFQVLTHDRAKGLEAPAYATYSLLDREPTEKLLNELSSATHFYWMSATAFDRAVELVPEVRKGHHACGPGRTLEGLQQRLGSSVEVFLTYKAWRSVYE